ncbi:MAG: bL28 family ribosomal protein [bacterium]|nr:bL28 family ribosomal protein [bacterium]
MAKKISGKKPMFGNNRPNCLKATRKKQGVNLQTVTLNGKKYRVSARELRTIKQWI